MTVRELVDQHAALDYIEMRDRIANLESDVTTYRILACAALENVAQLTKRNRQLASRISCLNAELRAVLDAPCLVCRRRDRSDRAA